MANQTEHGVVLSCQELQEKTQGAVFQQAVRDLHASKLSEAERKKVSPEGSFNFPASHWGNFTP